MTPFKYIKDFLVRTSETSFARNRRLEKIKEEEEKYKKRHKHTQSYIEYILRKEREEKEALRQKTIEVGDLVYCTSVNFALSGTYFYKKKEAKLCLCTCVYSDGSCLINFNNKSLHCNKRDAGWLEWTYEAKLFQKA